jgi:hypothetical protein
MGSCECSDEPLGSGAMELVMYKSFCILSTGKKMAA